MQQAPKKYILSAWVKSVEGNVPIEKNIVVGVNYRKLKGEENEFPIILYGTDEVSELPCLGEFSKKQIGDWVYIKQEINVSQDVSVEQWDAGYQYLRIWVGAPLGNNNHPQE